jgi:hypothetical protein
MSEQVASRRLSTAAAGVAGTRRTAAIVLVVVACCFVLGLVLGGVHDRVGPPPAEHAFSRAVAYTVIVTFGLSAGVALFSAAFARGVRERAKGRPEQRTWWQQLLIWCAAIVLAAAPALVIFRVHGYYTRAPFSQQLLPQVGNARGTQPGATAPSHIDWPYLVAAAVGAVAGVLLLAYLYRQGARSRTSRLTDDAELATAAAAAIEELEAEPDPRRAVIRSYASLESSLGRHGVPRGAAETPFEYLVRMLEHHDAGSRAATRLTPLFERAKFSRHEIDEDTRREAIAALRDLGSELEQ